MTPLAPRRPGRPKTRREARANQRERLLEAMGYLAGSAGYANTSVAQVCARSGVSRKAFYEYFPDKEACFLAAYEEISERLLKTLLDTGGSGPERTRALLKRFLEAFANSPIVGRAFMVEVLAAGPRALAMREEVNRRFSELVLRHLSVDPIVRKAIAGGINDVIGSALRKPKSDLGGLLEPLTDFVLR